METKKSYQAGAFLFYGNTVFDTESRLDATLFPQGNDPRHVEIKKWTPENKYFDAMVSKGLAEALPAKIQVIKGRGYEGQPPLGWTVERPEPPRDAILWWDSTRQGAFFGYWPSITVLLPA